MRVPRAISLSADWMQPLGSWRAAIKSSVRLNVSGPEKQCPINSTEPDVPKKMDLAKSLWKCFFWNEKHSERKEELACAHVLLAYRIAWLVVDVYFTCLWKQNVKVAKKWNQSQQYHSGWINANVTYAAFIMLRSMYFCFHWFFFFVHYIMENLCLKVRVRHKQIIFSSVFG